MASSTAAAAAADASPPLHLSAALHLDLPLDLEALDNQVEGVYGKVCDRGTNGPRESLN